MIRAKIVGAFIAAAVLAGAVSASGQTWTGNANLLLAGKRLDADQWQPTDREGELGLQTDFQRTNWPVAVAADLLAARSDASIAQNGFTEQRSRTSELDLGARKYWRPGPHVSPYLGGGLALVTGELEMMGPGGTVSDTDSGAGVWIGGGIKWILSDVFNIGIDAKLSHADVSLFGSDKNAGGFHLGLLAGYHWGA
jgi:opacity protein-like surface antigen